MFDVKKIRLSIMLFCSIPFMAGCSSAGSHSMGAPVSNPNVIAVSELKPATSSVTIRGVMFEKCPVAGCWFKLRDKSGEIKVDTKAAGFVVSSIPLETEITVQGKFIKGDESRVAATGITY